MTVSLNVSLSPAAVVAVAATASGEPSTFVLLRVSRFVLQGDDPELQISLFEIKTRDEFKEYRRCPSFGALSSRVRVRF